MKRKETLVGISAPEKLAFIDRNRAGDLSYSKEAAWRYSARIPQTSSVKLQIFVDRSSVETFVNGGEVTLTDRVYPFKPAGSIEIYSQDGKGKIKALSIWKLDSVWK